MKIKLNQFAGKIDHALDVRTIRSNLEKFGVDCKKNEFDLEELLSLIIKKEQEESTKTLSNRFKKKTSVLSSATPDSQDSDSDFSEGGFIHRTEPMTFEAYHKGRKVKIQADKEEEILVNQDRAKSYFSKFLLDLRDKLDISAIWNSAINFDKVDNPDQLVEMGKNVEFEVRSYVHESALAILEELESQDPSRYNSTRNLSIEELNKLADQANLSSEDYED